MIKFSKIILLTLLVNVSLSAHSQINIYKHFIYQGVNRSYIVHLPYKIYPSLHLPVVFVLHGSGGNAANIKVKTHYDDISDTANFVVCYPNAYDGWADGMMASAADSAGIDDVGFISAIIDTLIDLFFINPERIYAQGLSSGGFMCQRLACDLSDRIAAVATVAATFAESMTGQCNPLRPVPVMLIHGTNDPDVPEAGGLAAGLFPVLSTSSTVNFWKEKNGSCPASPQIIFIPQLGLSPFTSVMLKKYSFCNDSSEILWYSVIGGGHNWPGIQPVGSGTGINLDINAGIEGWKFFKRHHLTPLIVTSVPDNIKTGDLKISVDSNDNVLGIFFNGNEKWARLSILSSSGKIIRSYYFSNLTESAQLDIPLIPSGIYFISVETDLATYVKKLAIIR